MGKKYYIILAILVVLFILINLGTPNNINWTPTYKKKDKIPYGSAAVFDLLEDIYGEGNVEYSRKSPMEYLSDSNKPRNFIFIADTIHAHQTEADLIFKNVYNGGNVFIASHRLGGDLGDRMGIDNGIRFFNFFGGDSVSLNFTNPELDQRAFWFNQDHLLSYISVDSTKSYTVLSQSSDHKIHFLKYEYGQGNIFYHSSPMLFTNYNLLHASDQHTYLSSCLSYMPKESVVWSEYYSTGGSVERDTEMKYILSTVQLRWAYYILIGSIAFFMIFQSKRRQRAIPVVTPPKNTTLQFVRTTGRLYFQQRNHLDLARKRIRFCLEKIRRKFFINTNTLDLEFVETLASKSGVPQEEVKALIGLFNKVAASDGLSEMQLIQLNKRIESFYKKASI